MTVVAHASLSAPVPLVRAIPYVEPLRALAPFAAEPMAVLFDCPEPGARLARYAYLCVSPYRTIRAEGSVSVDGRAVGGDPWDVLEREMAPCRTALVDGLPPFQGGAAGVLAYELNRCLERLPALKPGGVAFPEMAVGLYDVIAAFDCISREAWIISSGLPERDEGARLGRAAARADRLASRIEAASPLPAVDEHARACVRAEISRAVYEERIRRTKDYIVAGDIFQANITQRFLGTMPDGLSPLDLYRRLRARTSAPFSLYLTAGPDEALLSVSPERFLSVDPSGEIETRPIKGTRPRGRTPEEDALLAAELLASEKDRAENLMIVDLMRNDLSRVAELGSVRVPTLFGLETYSTVHHLVSTVHGRLKPGFSPVDLLRAAFPGGSITGAPKIRAMEIITELEPAPRGPYCGSAFWLGFAGGMDSSILIRSPVVSGREVLIQAGGGIVADSEPEAEYEECLVKAKAMIEAVQIDSGVPADADLG